MCQIRLQNMSSSLRIFVSLILCVIALNYVMLLSSIWIDTEMKISYVIEGYANFYNMELVEHSFKYLFWFVGIFSFMMVLFVMSNCTERIKRLFAIAIPLLIVSDICSMWLIRYHDLFAWQLYGSGFLLAVSFLLLFCCLQYELISSFLRKTGI